MQPPAEQPAGAPVLAAEEIRVLACLIEKQATTPEYYPLTLKALVAACNQKNNRDPVVGFDDATVERVLDGLREKRLAALVTTAGSRAPKFKHLFPGTFGLDEKDTAILCELMLRGPQTPGELRPRAARFTAFADPADVQRVLDGLAARPAGALVTRLARQPGQKEARYAHLLAGPVAAEGEPAAALPLPAADDRVARLEATVAALRAEVDALKRDLERLARPLI